MPLPDLTESGDLPSGIHPATLAESITRFGVGTDRRKRLATRLERVYNIAAETGQLIHFVVFGSFVTNKSEPNDVDIFIMMDDDFDVSLLSGESRLLFDHSGAQDHFGCSVFWLRRSAAADGEAAALESWQVKRDGTLRGIVEITQG